ncbi:KpsF/GutQ family sugar-phosphate isomerase [Candidatus Dependentiae bacterium]|nr:KpsF/GutQ family sugar-phosphate isomerase [Candidatus Dependentiae bacterium]
MFVQSQEKLLPAKYSNDIKTEMLNVLNIESQAIINLINYFPISSINLVEKILNSNGRVIFSGMGKSGLIAQKLVATFSSTGTPAIFLHPSEALHGDLGMLKKDDIFIALSKSGSGVELEQIIQILKNFGNFTALISCGTGVLSKLVDLPVTLPFTQEACQMNLAPTTSSTLTMAFGDALSVTVSKLKKFDKNDFALFHPAGALGKKLLLKVSNLIINQDLPFISLDTKFEDLLFVISSKRMGAGIIVNSRHNLLGIITDGDLRRAMQSGASIFEKTAKDIMTINPKVINKDILAYDALLVMENFNITSLVVIDDFKKVVGLVHVHDILKAGIVK